MSKHSTSEAEVGAVSSTADLILGVATGLSPIGPAVALYKIFEERKARKLERIVRAFISENGNSDEVRDFLNECDSDSEQEELFSEKLLDVLGDIDEEDKSKIIGKLFKCHRKGKISREMFFNLSKVIEKATLNTLYALKSWRNQPESVGSLIGVGLLQITFKKGPQTRLTGEQPERELDYEPTPDCHILMRLGVLNEWL